MFNLYIYVCKSLIVRPSKYDSVEKAIERAIIIINRIARGIEAYLVLIKLVILFRNSRILLTLLGIGSAWGLLYGPFGPPGPPEPPEPPEPPGPFVPPEPPEPRELLLESFEPFEPLPSKLSEPFPESPEPPEPPEPFPEPFPDPPKPFSGPFPERFLELFPPKPFPPEPRFAPLFGFLLERSKLPLFEPFNDWFWFEELFV